MIAWLDAYRQTLDLTRYLTLNFAQILVILDLHADRRLSVRANASGHGIDVRNLHEVRAVLVDNGFSCLLRTLQSL